MNALTINILEFPHPSSDHAPKTPSPIVIMTTNAPQMSLQAVI